MAITVYTAATAILAAILKQMERYFDMRYTPLKSGYDGLSNVISLVLIFQPVPKLDWGPLATSLRH
jgi:hypothetical protein